MKPQFAKKSPSTSPAFHEKRTPTIKRMTQFAHFLHRRSSEKYARPHTAPLLPPSQQHTAPRSRLPAHKAYALQPSRVVTRVCYKSDQYESFPDIEAGRCSSCVQFPWLKSRPPTLESWHDPSARCDHTRHMSPSSLKEVELMVSPRPSIVSAHLPKEHVGNGQRRDIPSILLDGNEQALSASPPASDPFQMHPLRPGSEMAKGHWRNLPRTSLAEDGLWRRTSPGGSMTVPKLHHIHGLPHADDHPYFDERDVAKHLEAIRAGQASPVTAFQRSRSQPSRLCEDERHPATRPTALDQVLSTVNSQVPQHMRDKGTVPNDWLTPMPATPPETNGIRIEMRSGSPEGTPRLRGGFSSSGSSISMVQRVRDLFSKGSCMKKFLCLKGDAQAEQSAINRPARVHATAPSRRTSCKDGRSIPIPSHIRQGVCRNTSHHVDTNVLPPLYFESTIPMTNLTPKKRHPKPRSSSTGTDEIPILRGGGGSRSRWSETDRLPATLWFLSGGSAKRAPGTFGAWKQQKPRNRMGGLIGMAVFGHRAGEPYAWGEEAVGRRVAASLATTSYPAAGMQLGRAPTMLPDKIGLKKQSWIAIESPVPAPATTAHSPIASGRPDELGPFMSGALPIGLSSTETGSPVATMPAPKRP